MRADYVGCGVGDPNRADVRWLTGTDSDARRNKLLNHENSNSSPCLPWLCCSLRVASSRSRHAKPPTDTHVVRCAVIGGMTMTGLWPEIAKMFEAETGYRIEARGDRPAPRSR